MPAPVGWITALHFTRRRVWWAAFAVFAGLGALWALGTPLFSVPDEAAHVTRAAAVARGKILPGELTDKGYTNYIDVPAIYAKGQDVASCYHAQMDTTAGCEGRFTGSTETATVETSAGLYQPAYYVVGLPSLLFPNATGVYLMRLVSVALSAAFLASAVASVWLLGSGRRLLAVAVAFTVTPKMLFLMGSVNPNGLEAAAAVCLWAALAVALTNSDPEQQRRLMVRAAVAGSTLAVARPGSVIWVVLIAAAVAVWAGHRPVIDFMRQRPAWFLAGSVALACALSIGWILYYGTLKTVPGPPPYGGSLSSNTQEAFGRATSYLNGAVGVFGSKGLDARFTIIPVYLCLAALGALGVLALASASRWRQRLTLLCLVGAVVALPALLQIPRAATDGFPWQGRYILALLAGVPILAGLEIVRSRQVPEVLVNRLGTVLAIAFFAMQAFAYIWAIKRFDAGIDVLTAG